MTPPAGGPRFPQALIALNDTLLFRVENQLWRSDGTGQGTAAVNQFDAGLYFYDAVVFGDAVYFTVNRSLWRSDGTAEGTTLVKGRGAHRDAPFDFVEFNGTLYFTWDEELWRSDGTTENTRLVRKWGSGFLSRIFSTQNSLYLVADGDTVNTGKELWRSDGTAQGTVLIKDIRPGFEDSYILSAISVGDRLFFGANDGTRGSELWSSDGTSAGTVLVKDIWPGSGGSYPGQMVDVDGKLFFFAKGPGTGYELWKSDGTSAGTTRLTDIHPGPEDSYPLYHFEVNGNSFFVLKGHLWKSDGTAAGTARVDLIPDGRIEEVGPTAIMGRSLFFGARLYDDAHAISSYVLMKLEPIQGDTNYDNTVDLADFNRLKKDFGRSGDGLASDFNSDEVVNLLDFNILKGNFGVSASLRSNTGDGRVDGRSGAVERRDRREVFATVVGSLAKFGNEIVAIAGYQSTTAQFGDVVFNRADGDLNADLDFNLLKADFGRDLQVFNGEVSAAAFMAFHPLDMTIAEWTDADLTISLATFEK